MKKQTNNSKEQNINIGMKDTRFQSYTKSTTAYLTQKRLQQMGMLLVLLCQQNCDNSGRRKRDFDFRTIEYKVSVLLCVM